MNTDKPPVEPDLSDEPAAVTPERAPEAGTYGYETDHPSYKLRNAGDWTRPTPPGKDYRPGHAPTPKPPRSSEDSPEDPGEDIPA